MSQWPIRGPYEVIATLTLTAPLGLRFRDEATGRYVGDGLRVTAYPASQPAQRVEAVAGRSGVYGFRQLPGLREFAQGRGDDEFWRSPEAQPRLPFIVEVIDAERRFLPFRWELRAPQRGVYLGEELLLDSPLPPFGVPLFSTPTRIAPAAMAVVRAELREPPAAGERQGRVAAWALLEARLDGRLLARGLADEAGRATLIFPWPAPETNPLIVGAGSGSPDGTGGVALREQVWPLQLRAFYQRVRATAPALPDLREVLKQASATLWDDAAAQTVLAEAALHYGQELILRSYERPSGAPLSELLISPAGSPP